MNHKEAYLIQSGWKQVQADSGGTCWQAPPNCSQTDLYFGLDDAYALEWDGEGIHAYAGKQALIELSRANDVACVDRREAERYARTGVRRGVPPNY